MNLFLGYVVIAGTVTAGAQIARGAVQAIHKATEGKYGEGLWKLAGGLVTPAIGAGTELLSLGVEALAVGRVLSGKVKGRMARRRIPNCATAPKLG